MDFLDKQVESPILKDRHFEVLRATEMWFTFLETSDPILFDKKGQLPSSMFKVSNFLMKDLHFSILDVHKTILTPWASLKISTMLGASETFFCF